VYCITNYWRCYYHILNLKVFVPKESTLVYKACHSLSPDRHGFMSRPISEYPWAFWTILSCTLPLLQRFPLAIVNKAGCVIPLDVFLLIFIGYLATLGSAGIASTFNHLTENTDCFIIGLCSHQANRFKRQLIELKSHCSDPRLPALVWIAILTEVRLLRAAQRRVELENIQLLTGMHLSIEENLLHKSSIDIDAITHKITVLWHGLTWDEFALKTLLQAHKRLKESFPNGSTPVFSAQTVLDIRMTNIHDLLVSLQSRTASSIQHANIQLQTVS
jgi:hypothetical protein